jgi:hypothetical protein
MASPSRSTPSFKNKTLSAALAAFLGLFGAHRFYLEGASGWRPWLYPMWFFGVGTWALNHLERLHPDFPADLVQLLHPALFLAVIPGFVGFVEALVFSLTPDARWDQRHNGGTGRTSHSGSLAIIIAIVTLAGGMTALLSVLAISTEAFVEATPRASSAP